MVNKHKKDKYGNIIAVPTLLERNKTAVEIEKLLIDKTGLDERKSDQEED